MSLVAGNPRAVVGGNNPPEPTPFEKAEKEINDLYDECRLWLDGAAVDNKDLADGVGNLLTMLRAAEKRADEARTAEKRPLDEQIAAIQAKYAPLIGNTKAVKGKTVLATEACKKALQPWLDAEQRRIQEAARKAREEAEAKEREAQEALRKSREAADLKAREEAEALLAAAKKADKAATKAEKQTATVGNLGRAISLRTIYIPTVTDPTAFARYVWTNHKQEMDAFLSGFAKRLFDAGYKNVPGVTIAEEKQAV